MELHISAAPSPLDRTIRRPRAVIGKTDELSRQCIDARTLSQFSSQASLQALFPDDHGIDVRFGSNEAELFIPFGMNAKFNKSPVSAQWITITPNDWPHQLCIGGLWLDLMVVP